ncbi:hypothetical protein THRCLA_21691 [Thraustotheca clavata]|uniref:Cystatin domain-containing protein n=1 Tax=Thraustotheca clavata TaxID=74557 RepID=A0A1V9ZQS9_9STRA|nr:hypothetical protein THRCLA_21691 [Thraustotheca clavata]
MIGGMHGIIASLFIGMVSSSLPGGWTPTSVLEAKPVLYHAFQNASSYFVCVASITSAEIQVVAGTKYKFHVVGCPVSSKDKTIESCAGTYCPSTDPDQASYEIDIFTPLSGNSYQLKSVTLVEPSAEVSVGGWKEGVVEDATDDLYNGISKETSYKNKNLPRVCVSNILRVRQQVVSGMNYQFDVKGCVVDTAVKATRGCVCHQTKEYKIALYAQSWSHTYKVLSVEAVDSALAPLVGSWKKSEMTSEAKEDFYNAITNDTANAHICASSFRAVQTQVVAGTNYRFTVEGCTVPTALATGPKCTCQPNALKQYLITVFAQSWTNTYKVVSVYEEAQLLQLVAQWIQKNNLNRFGDPKDTAYLGGTPLMNELTGESMTLLEYVTEMHPDLPWLATKQVSLSLQLNNEPESAVDASAKPLAVIGLVVSCLLIVSLYVLHKTSQKRTKSYEQLQAEPSR